MINDQRNTIINPHDLPKPAGVDKKIPVIMIVSLGLLAGLWIWKSIQIKNIKKQAATEMQQLQEKAHLQIRQAHELHLKSLVKPFVWSVRTEMLKNNLSQVNLYVNEMVKEKNFHKIVITDEKGMVILSTNKKEEGAVYTSTGKLNHLAADTTSIKNINDSLMIMSSPVMGFNNRLGTLIVQYAAQYGQVK